MTWEVGKTYKTRGGLDAEILKAVNQWLVGFVSTGAAPQAVRWNANTGISDAGGSFHLNPPAGNMWVAVFYLRGERISSHVAGTEEEARRFGSSGGNTLIQVFEVVL